MSQRHPGDSPTYNYESATDESQSEANSAPPQPQPQLSIQRPPEPSKSPWPSFVAFFVARINTSFGQVQQDSNEWTQHCLWHAKRQWGTFRQGPSVPDTLCIQCLAIFKKDLTTEPYDENVLEIDTRNLDGCRLCAVFISRFHSCSTVPSLHIEYVVATRFGYFFQNWDILFRVVGSTSWNTDVVRLALQKAKLNEKDHNDTKMVHFEPKVPLSTDSEKSLAQAAMWFKDCSEGHEECKAASPTAGFVPARLIEILGSDIDSLGVRLRETKDLPAQVGYATLSHCWGKKPMPFMLTLDRVDLYKGYIPLNELSQSFRDAIEVAWRLSIPYIWIDSLCIIQNSMQDWITQSSEMGAIYNHSILNIAATGFPDGEKGLFVKRNSSVLVPISVSIEADQYTLFRPGADDEHRQKELDKGDYYLVDTGSWRDGVDESPLCKRGWVTQERALFIRTLHFGQQQLFWECKCGNASEVFPRGFLSGTRIENPKVFLTSVTKSKKERAESLQAIRKIILDRRESDEEYRVLMEDMRIQHMALDDEPKDEDDDSEDMSDGEFAKSMKALQTNGNQFTDEESDSSDSELEVDYSNPSNLFKPIRHSVKGLKLSAKDFDGCDLNILDGLDIKGWKKFKTELQDLGFGGSYCRVKSLPVRGMLLEQSQWLTVVEIFSRCSLSFSKDKLVAISGMAKSLSQEMNCDYLAGLWRKDLEHQILWKVEVVRPAPKKDGTRGPSWSWASVDGAIKIPEWSGFFYDGLPGDITWLAKVGDASVQLAETGTFGQVKAGSMNLTGRLGVFRIDKENSSNPISRNGDIIPTKRWVHASWDTKEVQDIFAKPGHNTDLPGYEVYLWRYSSYRTGKRSNEDLDPLDVFYMPVRIMEADPNGYDYERPMLTGLLLLPTGKRKGEYRRVGQFELSEHDIRSEDGESIESLTETTRISDNRFFVSRRKNGEYTICVV